jgi:hypothetical protein
MSKYDIEDYDEGGYLGVNEKALYKIMIEFAKLHVEQALKAKVDAMTDKSYDDSSYSMNELDSCTKDSYPLENIK